MHMQALAGHSKEEPWPLADSKLEPFLYAKQRPVSLPSRNCVTLTTASSFIPPDLQAKNVMGPSDNASKCCRKHSLLQCGCAEPPYGFRNIDLIVRKLSLSSLRIIQA